MALQDDAPLPDVLRQHLAGSTRADVLGHDVEVRPGRWMAQTAKRGLPAPVGRFASGDTFRISRGQVLAAADNDITPENAVQLWYAAMAWGLGTRARSFYQRLDGLADDFDTNNALLVDAWAAVRSGAEPQDCYRVLLTEKGATRITFFGAAFVTKYLYFAHGTTTPVRNLILDEVVATNLRPHGWPESHTGAWWPTTYQRYCDLLGAWARDATEARGAPVQPDEVEKAVFQL